MRNYPVQILNGDDSISLTGSPIWVGQEVAGSFVAVCGDATATGTLKIEGSNAIPTGAPAAFVPAASSFADIPNATSSIASGVGPAIILQSMNFQYIRAIYTSASGGSTTIQVNASFLGV